MTKITSAAHHRMNIVIDMREIVFKLDLDDRSRILKDIINFALIYDPNTIMPQIYGAIFGTQTMIKAPTNQRRST